MLTNEKNNHKTLALITSSSTETEALCEQLRMLLAGYAEVESFLIDEDSSSAPELRAVDAGGAFLGTGDAGLLRADLILFSSPFTAVKAACLAPLNCPSLIAARSLNTKRLDALFHLPDRTEIVLSGSSQEAAEYLLRLLTEIGIDFLHFVPYWPDTVYEGRSPIAVTAGDTILVPSCVKRVVDLGPYLIDVTTTVDILRRLNLPEAEFQLAASRCMKPYIRLSRRLSFGTASAESRASILSALPRSTAAVDSAPASHPQAVPGKPAYRNIYGIDFSKIDETLYRRGSQEEFIAILSILSDVTSTGNHATRDGIAKLISRTGRTLTVDQIRRRCDTLQQEGLLTKSRGRGGMRLTLKGKEYISHKLFERE